MANRNIDKIKLKRSNVLGKIPTLGQLELGEIALNTADAKLYTEYTGGASGSTDVREIGWNRVNVTGDTMTGTLYGPSISATTIDGGNILSGGTNISTLFSTTDYYTTGSTLINNTLYFHRNDSLSAYTVDLSSISGGGGGGGHEIYNGTDITPLTQRDGLRFEGYLQATDDAGNNETVVDLSSTAITPTEISRFDENGSGNIDLKIAENKLLTGTAGGFATELSFAQEGILGLDINNEVKEFEAVEIYNILKEDAVTANKQLALTDIAGSSSNVKAKFEISAIVVQNTTANAVTINIGSVALGTDVANTVPIGANATLKLPLGTTFFSTTLGQNLFISSSSWNSASINIHVTISKIWQ